VEVKPPIDRRKNDVDVLEQVMRGVQTQADGHAPQVVDLGVRGWAAGVVISAVQVRVLDDDSDR
jgi:hypothetical protein